MLDYPSVSIVLLNYNGQRFAYYWENLFALNYPKSRYEIIFVDNGSSDGSEDLFAKMAHQSPDVSVRIVKLEKNCGYSKANNIGAGKAVGDYVVLLSNDIWVSRDWLKNAIDILELDKRIGVAQSMMYMIDDPSKPDKMGNYIDVIGLNYPFQFSNETKEVFYGEGAVMFIRRSILADTNGLFDETYFMFYEDIDFCWRARLMGYNIVVIHNSIVHHRRGGTVSGILMKMEPLYVFTNTRNRLNTLLKNYSTRNVIRFIPISVAAELMKGSYLIISGKVPAGLSCYKGILSFITGLRETMRRRAAVQGKRRISDKDVMKLMIPKTDALRYAFTNIRKLQLEWKGK